MLLTRPRDSGAFARRAVFFPGWLLLATVAAIGCGAAPTGLSLLPEDGGIDPPDAIAIEPAGEDAPRKQHLIDVLVAGALAKEFPPNP